jgi:hypothetical protein
LGDSSPWRSDGDLARTPGQNQRERLDAPVARPTPETKQRALALLQSGHGAAAVGKLVGVHRRTVEKWAAAGLPARRIDPVRAVAEEALASGTLTERLRAAELLTKLGATEKLQGSGRVEIHLGPDTCPHCGGSLREPAESEIRDTAGDTVRANPLHS